MATRAVAHAVEVEPLNDNVLIRRIEDKVDSLIEVPDSAKIASNKGIVVATGEYGLRFDLPQNLKVGQRVVFTKYGAMEIEVGDETLVLVRYPEVYARFRA
jgi:chaperonin GroES